MVLLYFDIVAIVVVFIEIVADISTTQSSVTWDAKFAFESSVVIECGDRGPGDIVAL